MASALGQYLFYKPATFETSMIHITTKYKQFIKYWEIVCSVKVHTLVHSVIVSWLAGSAGDLGRE